MAAAGTTDAPFPGGPKSVDQYVRATERAGSPDEPCLVLVGRLPDWPTVGIAAPGLDNHRFPAITEFKMQTYLHIPCPSIMDD